MSLIDNLARRRIEYLHDKLRCLAQEIRNLEDGGGGTETDPIFTASPAFSITEEDKLLWNTSASGDFVDLTTDQTIQGIKTFDSQWTIFGAAGQAGKIVFPDPVDGSFTTYGVIGISSTKFSIQAGNCDLHLTGGIGSAGGSALTIRGVNSDVKIGGNGTFDESYKFFVWGNAGFMEPITIGSDINAGQIFLNSGGINPGESFVGSIGFMNNDVDSPLGIINKNGSVILNSEGNTVTLKDTGNFLIGTDVDTGDKLNVSGSAYISSWLTVSEEINTASMRATNFYATGTVNLAAGSTSNTPLIFTSGPLNTTPVVGAMEFLNDKYYGVITTGGARREFAMFGTTLSQNQVVYMDTAGKLLGNSSFVFTSANGGRMAIGGASQSSNLNVSSPVQTSGNNPLAIFKGAAHTNQTASTEGIDVLFDMNRTVQSATGNYALQRSVAIFAPTYSFVGASTITTGVTLYISGAPAVGTNATITNSYALLVNTGLAHFGGGISTSGTSTLNGTTTIGGSVLPTADNTYSIGAISNRFSNAYVGHVISPGTLTLNSGSSSFAIHFRHANSLNIFAGFSVTNGNLILQTPGSTLTADSGDRLQVNGTSYFAGNLLFDGNITRNIGSSTGRVASLYTAVVDGNGTLRFRAGTANSFIFSQTSDANTLMMLFGTTGNLALQGPSSFPVDTGERLQVYGAIKNIVGADGAGFKTANAIAGDYITLHHTSVTGSATDYFLAVSDDAGEVKVNSSGTIISAIGGTTKFSITTSYSSIANILLYPGTPTYADNAAAVTGGLPVDGVYKTATGEVRIRV